MPRSIFATATRIIWRDNCLAKQPRMRLGNVGQKTVCGIPNVPFMRTEQNVRDNRNEMRIYMCVYIYTYRGFERELMVFEETFNCMT